MELTEKISPRVAAEVARRLRLAASLGARSMSAVVNDALDEVLPSLEDIRMQLAVPAAGEPGALAAIAAGGAGPAAVPVARGPAGRAVAGRDEWL